MLHRIALLTNPAAGRGTAVQAADDARARFHELGIDVISLGGASKEASLELAGRALEEDVDALVVCGGDGLVNLALQKQAHTGRPLGIIPAGTGNDLANEFGIPIDARKAADIVAAGNTKVTDLGILRACDNPDKSLIFATIACQGFDSLTNARTNKLKWPKGPSRYAVASFIEIIGFKSIPTRIQVDGEENSRELHTTLIAIGNTRYYGGAAPICPNADPTDGLFDITIVNKLKPHQTISKLSKIFKGEGHVEPDVTTLRTAKIRIEMDRDIPSYTDGEHFGSLPIEAEILPKAGCFIVP